MKLSRLLQNQQPLRWIGPQEAEITVLCNDSRKLVPGAAFFAVRGQTQDGHQFIPQAIAAGAAAIFMEDEQPLPAGICGIVVADVREALAFSAANFFENPDRNLQLVGVTGTNGKTTTTYLIESILRSAGQAPAVIGTVSYRFGDRQLPASHTTPDAIELLAALAEFRDLGATAVVMEVSSHALDQRRVDGLHFATAVFTNLTPEHLDYHLDMEQYFVAKRRLFAELLLRSKGRGAICIDDLYGQRLADEFPDAITCGMDTQAAIHPLQLTLSVAGISAVLASPLGPLRIESQLVGPFNVQNLLCAAAAGVALGYSAETIEAGLNAAPPVPGRLERVENQRGALILVDYAHTGDALEKALAAVATLNPKRIITVFGCGGDRDRRKRPVMGEVVARHAQLAIITSDNPRTEDPLAIIAEVEAGVQRVHPRPWSVDEAQACNGSGYLVIPDRRAAIRFAVSLLGSGDLLLVAGKGHEDYQIIGREKFHFDDREELRAALASKG